MADDVIDRIEELRPDARPWWLRWVDRYQSRADGPFVEALISPLGVALADLTPALAAKEASRFEGTQRVRFRTGLLPRLKLGTVFRDGVVVDSLPSPERTFQLDRAEVTVCSLADNPSETPEGWGQFPYRFLNRGEYPLGGDFLGSKVVVARGRGFTLILPCHEVFRALYAPHREIALTLTAGPWDAVEPTLEEGALPSLGWGRVADPRRTGILPDGNWRIALRKEIDDRFAEVLANLILSESGRRAANAIYRGSLGAFDSSPQHLHAEMPFDRLGRIEVRCMRLPTDKNKFLAFEITAVEWPRPNTKVFLSRENDGTEGRTTTPSLEERPYLTRKAATGEEPTSVTSDEDPSRARPRVSMAADAPRWLNGPRVIKLAKDHSFKYRAHSWVRPSEPPGRAGAGQATSGQGEVAIADYAGSERYAISTRFREVAEVLSGLVRTGRIESWRTVPPARGRMWHGHFQVWRVPLVRSRRTNRDRSWSFIDPVQRRRRGALVCRIVCRGHSVYWVELEVRENEGGFKALVFQTMDENPVDAVTKLLRCVAQRRGVWPAVEVLRAEASVLTAMAWSHSHVAAEGSVTQGARLNGVRALEVIQRVASGGPDASAVPTPARE
jgi:hypothetical protein